MKYIFDFSVSSEMSVEDKDRIAAGNEMNRLVSLLVQNGFAVESARNWLDDEKEE